MYQAYAFLHVLPPPFFLLCHHGYKTPAGFGPPPPPIRYLLCGNAGLEETVGMSKQGQSKRYSRRSDDSSYELISRKVILKSFGYEKVILKAIFSQQEEGYLRKPLSGKYWSFVVSQSMPKVVRSWFSHQILLPWIKIHSKLSPTSILPLPPLFSDS